MARARGSLRKLVYNHIIYGLPEHRKRQSDLGHWITEGTHSVITDVQYQIALNDRMAGWALLFEGLKRIMRADIEAFNTERGLPQTCKTSTSGEATKKSSLKQPDPS